MEMILGFILIALFTVPPVIVTVFNIIQLIRVFNGNPIEKEFITLTDAYTMIAGIGQTAFLWGSTATKDYWVPIMSYEEHTFISSEHLLTVIILFASALLGYVFVRERKSNLPPLLLSLFMAFMMIGIILCVVIIVQLLKNITDANYWFMPLFPINFILCSIIVIKKALTDFERRDSEIQKTYDNKFLNFFVKIFYKKNSLMWGAAVLLLPVFAVIMIILLLFGQQPDSIIKAFTETADWTFSTKIPPPPLQGGHYLCTVAAKGHKKVVKPLRYGKRHGCIIVVNRQLQVANAFEQVISERCPKLHGIIRYMYDKYGYPLSRHINTPFSADVTYILMKPLELVFLAVLYLTTVNPETKISKQYI